VNIGVLVRGMRLGDRARMNNDRRLRLRTVLRLLGIINYDDFFMEICYNQFI
jgi:hypothetical protein